MGQKTQNASNPDDQSAAAAASAKDAAPSSRASASAAANPGSSSSQQSRLTELDAALRPTSHPMTKSVSSGSDPAAKDAGLETASPYGTRSRNRTATSRPNYAEDKDIDMDSFDYYPDKKDQEPKKWSRHSKEAASQPQDTQRSNGPSRKAPAVAATAAALNTALEEVKNNPPSSNAKEPPSGAPAPTAASGSSGAPASSGAQASAPQTSKKRKAASQSTGGTQSQNASAPTAAASGSSRRAAALAPPPGGYPETNMLSFDNCNARPKNGELVADDGTVLRPNGKTTTAFFRHGRSLISFCRPRIPRLRAPRRAVLLGPHYGVFTCGKRPK